MDINPWLAEVIMEYRQKHSDDYLRKRYISYLADRPETSWSSFLANVSLEYKMHREPFLKTPRREFGFPSHLQDLMNVMEINIVADMLQFTMVQPSVDRTYRWLLRCKEKLEELNRTPGTVNPEQYLFGINQGGVIEDIRIDHAKRIAELDLPGYAIGGLAVGETHEEMYRVLDVTVPHLPQDRPVYLMGVGTPENILEAVNRGVDFFDCVYPSRNGRHGQVYTHYGKLNLKNKCYEKDTRPIEEGCGCPACRRYSRAYIRHLLKAGEMLALRLAVLHNLYFYNHLMEEIRTAIREQRYQKFMEETLDRMHSGEDGIS